VPLAAGRLTLRACLWLVRLAVSTAIAVVVAVLLFTVGPIVAGGHSGALSDMNDYLSGVLRFADDWAGGNKQFPQDASGLISEVSSTNVARTQAPPQGSTAGLVTSLSPLSPPELRDLYQEAIPTLQQYDAMLGDVQGALANDRDLDTLFRDLEPWLKQSNDAAANP
jgi:hypothetical protein